MPVINRIDLNIFHQEGSPLDNKQTQAMFLQQVVDTIDSVVQTVNALETRVATLEAAQGIYNGTIYAVDEDSRTLELRVVKGTIKTGVHA